MARLMLSLFILLLAGTSPAFANDPGQIVSDGIKATAELTTQAVHAATSAVSHFLGLADTPPPSPVQQPPKLPPPPAPTTTTPRHRQRSMAREFLAGHNKVRSAYGESPLSWDRALARYARRWAEHIRLNNCTPVHSNGPYGENLFFGSGFDWTATDAVQTWAEEKFYYNGKDNSCRADQICGHFTQLIWSSTERVGCARVECDAGGVIMACSYDPPGNYVGENPLATPAAMSLHG